MIVTQKAFARAGLIGNPSDGFFGRTIALTMKNFRAEVTIEESPELRIEPPPEEEAKYPDWDTLLRRIRLMGYYGGSRLILSALKVFRDYCVENRLELPNRNFTLRYHTDIPVRVGLGGSSALVTAAMRALGKFYNVEFDKPILPNLILKVETQELGIPAGLQDRVAQVYEGAVFMDFDKKLMTGRGYGEYRSVDPHLLPHLFVAYNENLAEGTEVTHAGLRAKFDAGDEEVHAAVNRWADLAREAYQLILTGRGIEIGPLMDEGFSIRKRVTDVGEGNEKLAAIGNDLGAHVQLAGSGGAVIGSYDGDPERLERIRNAYSSRGACLIVPQIN